MLLSKEELGELIKKARELKSKKDRKKFTQNDLAKAIGKSRSYIGDIEVGRIYPSYRLLASIASACDVPLSFFGDSDSLLKEIIAKNYPDMNENDKKGFAEYIKNSIDTPYGILDWELTIWKDTYEEYKKQLNANDAIREDYKNEIEFTTPQAAMKFILEQPAIMGFGGFDVKKMSDEEIMGFANELLNQLKLLGFKYKK